MHVFILRDANKYFLNRLIDHHQEIYSIHLFARASDKIAANKCSCFLLVFFILYVFKNMSLWASALALRTAFKSGANKQRETGRSTTQWWSECGALTSDRK